MMQGFRDLRDTKGWFTVPGYSSMLLVQTVSSDECFSVKDSFELYEILKKKKFYSLKLITNKAFIMKTKCKLNMCL